MDELRPPGVGAASAEGPRDLARRAATIVRDEPLHRRLMAIGRPYICPIDAVMRLVPPGARVLDVGCGAGTTLLLLADRGAIATGVGFDPDRDAIAAARRGSGRVADRGGPLVAFETAGIVDPWPDGTFDVVLMIDVMHHLPSGLRHAAIQTAAGRLEPGGALVYKDMCRRPRWRRQANRLHDRLVARERIAEEPIERVVEWMTAAGLRVDPPMRLNRLWYGHELAVAHRGGGRVR